MMTKMHKIAVIGGAVATVLMLLIILRMQNDAEVKDPGGDSLAAKIANAPLTMNYSEHFFAKKKPETTSRSFTIIGYDFNNSTKTTQESNNPLQLNFVHRSEDDELAVVGIKLIKGAYNEAFDRVLNALTDDNVDATPDDMAALLPSEAPYTQPSDDVTWATYGERATWYQLDSPVTVSETQLAQLNDYYADLKR